MRYQRTQVYLDPEDHRRLKAEAARRGISLAALLREIASAHVAREPKPSYGEKSWDAIIGIDTDATPSDIGTYEDDYKREMWEAKAREVEEQIAEAPGPPKRKRKRA